MGTPTQERDRVPERPTTHHYLRCTRLPSQCLPLPYPQTMARGGRSVPSRRSTHSIRIVAPSWTRGHRQWQLCASLQRLKKKMRSPSSRGRRGSRQSWLRWDELCEGYKIDEACKLEMALIRKDGQSRLCDTFESQRLTSLWTIMVSLSLLRSVACSDDSTGKGIALCNDKGFCS